MRDAVLFQHAAHFDGLFGCVAAIAIHQQRGFIAQCFADHRYDGFGAAGPLVLVAATFGTDTEFEGVIAMRVTQFEEAGALVLQRDFCALHGRGIDAQRARLAAEKLANAFALALAAPIPQGCIQPREGAHEIGTGIFVFPLRDEAHEFINVESITAQRMGGHLAVEDLGCDVGIIGGKLADALGAVFGRDARDGDFGRGESFELGDFHASSGAIRAAFRAASRRRSTS